MLENKPDVVTDPVIPTTPSETETIRERIVEGVVQQKDGDIMNNIMNPQPVAQTPGGTSDVDSQRSSSSDSINVDIAALKLIETSTGRKFDNVDDAKKYLDGLNRLVGDQSVAKARDAEKILTNISQKFGKNGAELEQYLANLLITNSNTDTSNPSVKAPVTPDNSGTADNALLKRLDELEHSSQLSALEKKYPNASEVASEVAIIAKTKGISYVEAFEQSPLKNLVEIKAKEELGKNPIVTPSNKINNIDLNRAQEIGLKAQSGRATQQEQEELVKMVILGSKK